MHYVVSSPPGIVTTTRSSPTGRPLPQRHQFVPNTRIHINTANNTDGPSRKTLDSPVPGSVGVEGRPHFSPLSGAAKGHRYGEFADITKAGLSFGENFVYRLYEKCNRLSEKWMTHAFVCLTMVLYTAAGAVMFQVVEGAQPKKEFLLVRQAQNSFLNAVEDLKVNAGDSFSFKAEFIQTLYHHKNAIDSLLQKNQPLAELDRFENQWTFSNALLYCGTVYTTIEV